MHFGLNKQPCFRTAFPPNRALSLHATQDLQSFTRQLAQFIHRRRLAVVLKERLSRCHGDLAKSSWNSWSVMSRDILFSAQGHFFRTRVRHRQPLPRSRPSRLARPVMGT